MTYPWPTLMPMGIVVISCVRPSVQPSMGLGLCIAYKALGRNGLQFGMLMYPDGLHSAFMDAYGYCCWSVCPSIWPFTAFSGGCAFADKSLGTNGIKFFFFCFFFSFFFLRLGLGQRRAVVIIGGWLLPSLVDTGDICCHYWQHILVFLWYMLRVIALTLSVRGPSYLGLTRSISWLLMPWLLTSPGHQLPWYWLCRIGRFLSYLRMDFNYLRRINVEKWHKM